MSPPEILRGDRCASFLHGLPGVGVDLAGGREFTGRDLAGHGRFDPSFDLGDGGRGGCRGGFDLAARPRLAVGGAAGSVLCAIVRVERASQGESIVALADGVVRVLERGGRGRVLLGGVLFGTRGAGGVDGPLGHVDFFLWRSRAGRQDEQWQQHGANGAHREASIQRRSAPASRRAPWMPPGWVGVSMKTVAVHDRPREKLERLGAAALGDNELLAIVIGHGCAHASALDVANAMLAQGGLRTLARARHGELRRVPGIGAARAAQVLAAIELGRRSVVRSEDGRPQMNSPKAVAAYLLPQFGSGSVEQFGLLLLDTKHRVLRASVLSVGTLDASVVHPREVFREAMAAGAAAIVLFHNHPSGDPEPSDDDVKLTDRIAAAGVLMGIHVMDHVILADNRYYSFREQRRY